MKYALAASLVLLAACSNSTSSEYDSFSLQESAITNSMQENERAKPAYVSLFEQQTDGQWVLKPDAALVP